MNNRMLLILCLDCVSLQAAQKPAPRPTHKEIIDAQRRLAQEHEFELRLSKLLSERPSIQIRIAECPFEDIDPKRIHLKLDDQEKGVSLSKLIRYVKNTKSKEFDDEKRTRIEAYIASFFQGDRTLETFCFTNAIFKPQKGDRPYFFVIFNKPISIDTEE